MKTITLKILAEDIKSTIYTDADNCAITKALRRAGVNAYEGGGLIYNNGFIHIDTPKELGYRVKAMYASLDMNWDKIRNPYHWGEEVATRGILEPKDFEFTMEVPSEWAI